MPASVPMASVLAGVMTLGAWMSATADIYQWTDKSGTMHFSDRPPAMEDMDKETEPVDAPRTDSTGIPPDPTPQAPTHDSPVMGEQTDQPIEKDAAVESPPEPPATVPDEDPAQAPCVGDRCLDARPALASPLDGQINDQINDQADIKIGMTKRQVIAIWGSPDHARWRDMPEGAVNEWFYEEGPRFTQRIFFRGGKVVRVEIPAVPRP